MIRVGNMRPYRANAAVFFGGIMSVFFTMSACMTPSEKRDMQRDIFNVQTRLLTLERDALDNHKEVKTTGDAAAKRLASTRAELDRLNQDIRKIRGDIDTLRIGVVTGQMPGADSQQEGSVAALLAKLSERLDTLETTQAELLDAISKAGLKKNIAKAGARKAAGNLKELEAAFNAKRYKQVAEDAASLMKSAPIDERERVRFLLAESYFKLGQMRDAALKFNDFIESKPSKQYLPLVKMRIGDCFRNLGDASTAQLYYEELVKEFPGSDEASKAKERLTEIAKGKPAGNKG